MKKSTCPPMRPNWLASASIIAMFVSGGVWADPVQVWVQPDGNTFATAYALQNEARTYFGRAECNACGTLEYKWEFSDGASTGFASVADPRYIEYAAKNFAAFGTQWARLTVRETSNPGNTNSAQIDLQVIASASDNLNRQKNSAIDRGLRRLYQREQGSNTGASYWNDVGYSVGETGLALIAFENHGHNLQSPDSNIYKKTVRQGVQWLLDNASLADIDNQRCIGNPDTNGNGKGVLIGSAYHIYEPSIALLALVNSADRTFAQSYVAATSNSVNGMTLFDIAVDATDWMAWAQSDGSTGGGSTNYCYSYIPNGEGWFEASFGGSSVTDVRGYLYAYDAATLTALGGCGGTFNIDWGDGSTPTSYVDNQQWCYDNNPELSYYETGPSHDYAAAGTYPVSISYTANSITTPMCSFDVVATDGSAMCGAADAQSGAGGWSYSPNEARGDNSLTQWAVLGISEAKARWNIDVNPGVITQLDHWLNWSKCADGTFGYDGPGSWCNYQKVGAGLIMLKYVGRPLSDTDVQNALTYAKNNWTSTYEGNLSNLYSMYGLYKAMKVWGMTDLGNTTNTGEAWENQYAENLISTQNADGSWSNLGGWMYPSTAAAVAILAPEVASLPPVANAGGPYAPIAPNQMLQLNGANSYHQDPAKTLVLWQWDFDASNGMWWDTLPAPAAGEGGVGINPAVSYGDAGQDAAYTVTLRVTDNTSPTPMRATNTAVVNVTSGNVAPVAITNGPWSAVPNTPITFDASASYDPNACNDSSNPTCLGDSIVMYEWDLDGDGIYNGAGDGTPVTPDRKKVQKSYPNPISLPAKLRVTDEHGLTAVTTDALNVVSVALVYGQHYETCFRVSLNRFEDRIGLRIKFKNLGNAEAENVLMTLSSVPSNMTIVKATANLGDIPAGEEVVTACDATAKTADIELMTNRRIAPTGGWSWNADFDLLGNHYHITNLPPLN
jgi:hypothetical protein